MNVIQFLIPKCNLEYLVDTFTVQDALRKIQSCTYTSLPMIDNEGHYVGAVCEKDIIVFLDRTDPKGSESASRYPIRIVLRHTIINAVGVEISMKELAARAINLDFVPVIDSRGIFIGIVTQKTLSAAAAFTSRKEQYY